MVNKIYEFYKENQFLRVLLLFMIVLLPWLLAFLILTSKAQEEIVLSAEINRPVYEEAPVYHTKLESLKKDFSSPKEVTATCLECHTERHREILKTAHWNWEKEDYRKGEGTVFFGKRTALNNFCIGVQGSEQSCTRCHIGYGYSDENFDFNDKNAIDCLVCHDKTGSYKKAKGKAGFPATGDAAPDYSYIAQNVGSPGKANCGICHFWGGGGNNVKHGDLETALLDCSREVDVHMATEGANMECIECHRASKIGMENVGLPYSGNFDFVQTEMYMQINHMVSPKEESVGCIECHRRNDGRLENLSGFYMPGRDHHKWVDIVGVLLAILSIGGVVIHSILRIVIGKKY